MSVSIFQSDIGIPINFHQESGIVIFEALNSACLSMCQRDVRPPVHRRRGPRAFFMVSTGDSDIPSYCVMKDETAFKPLHGNPAFFHVRSSRCPLHLRQQTQGPSNRPIAERSLLLRCLWKVGLTLHSIHVISSRLETIWGKRSFHRVAVLKLMLL